MIVQTPPILFEHEKSVVENPEKITFARDRLPYSYFLYVEQYYFISFK